MTKDTNRRINQSHQKNLKNKKMSKSPYRGKEVLEKAKNVKKN